MLPSKVLRMQMEHSKGYGESEHTHIIILSVPCNLTPSPRFLVVYWVYFQ